MSKKHFIAIAAALKASKASRETCEALARTFQAFNPAFDKGRFLAACGVL